MKSYLWQVFPISIHAPLTGCDPSVHLIVGFVVISIHAPLTGCDVYGLGLYEVGKPFQSTHP